MGQPRCQSFTGGRGGFCSASLVAVASVGVASALLAASPESGDSDSSLLRSMIASRDFDGDGPGVPRRTSMIRRFGGWSRGNCPSRALWTIVLRYGGGSGAAPGTRTGGRCSWPKGQRTAAAGLQNR